MIRTSLVDADEKDLQAMAPPGSSPARNILSTTVPLSVVAFLVIYAVSRSPWIAAAIAGVLMVASIVSNVRFHRKVAGRRRDQQSGKLAVEVIEVEASRVFDIEPLGSHGPAFVFFAEDHKALLLIGQWMLDQPSFPSKAFRLRRWADSGQPIRIEARGPEIEPEQSPIRVPDASRVRDVYIIDAAPETLEQDLRRTFS
jgi:hypothetical protein